MALGKMSVNDMADALDISRTTVSRWMADRGPVPTVYVKQWAMITRTDPGWLLTGQVSDPTSPTDRPGSNTVGYTNTLTLLRPAA